MNNDENNLQGQLYLLGSRGYSAYEIAVQQGFVGTEDEWLASLVGPQGEPGTPFGDLTEEQKEELRGPEGKSAYEVSVDNGFVGTEEEWVNSFLTPDGYYNKEAIDEKMKEKVYFFQNVEEMKEYDLKQGDCVITTGYYIGNDGGGAEYIIVDDDTLTDDGGSIIELDNELYATLIIKNEINVKQFGAYGDGITDDTNAFINALNSSKKIYVPEGNYIISEPLLLQDKTEFYGNGYNSHLIFSGEKAITFPTDTPIIMINIHDLFMEGNATNICLDIERTDGTVAFTRSMFKNLYIKSFLTGLLSFQTWTLSFINVTFQSCTKCIELGSQTNCIDFINCSFSGTVNTTEANCSYCSNAQMIKFDNCNIHTNFFINIRNRSEVKFDSCYFENLYNNKLFSTGTSSNTDVAVHVTFSQCHGYQFDTPLEIDINNYLNNEIINNSIYNKIYLTGTSLNFGNYKFNNEVEGKKHVFVNGRNINSLGAASTCTQKLVNNKVCINGRTGTNYIYKAFDSAIPAGTIMRIEIEYSRVTDGETSYLRLMSGEDYIKNFMLPDTHNTTSTMKKAVVEYVSSEDIDGVRFTHIENIDIHYLCISTQGHIKEIDNIDSTPLIVKEIPTFNSGDFTAQNYSDGTVYKYYNNQWN